VLHQPHPQRLARWGHTTFVRWNSSRHPGGTEQRGHTTSSRQNTGDTPLPKTPSQRGHTISSSETRSDKAFTVVTSVTFGTSRTRCGQNTGDETLGTHHFRAVELIRVSGGQGHSTSRNSGDTPLRNSVNSGDTPRPETPGQRKATGHATGTHHLRCRPPPRASHQSQVSQQSQVSHQPHLQRSARWGHRHAGDTRLSCGGTQPYPGHPGAGVTAPRGPAGTHHFRSRRVSGVTPLQASRRHCPIIAEAIRTG
jgi:hypothetical protein